MILRKSFLKQGSFDAIDQLAFNTPEDFTSSVQTLASYLVSLGETDIQKIRALFAWIASHIAYDVEAYISGQYTDQTAATVLKKRKAVCEGYSNLFYELARSSGFKDRVWIVAGWATGSAFDETLRGQSNDTAHAWNAVKIDNEFVRKMWYLANDNEHQLIIY